MRSLSAAMADSSATIALATEASSAAMLLASVEPRPSARPEADESSCARRASRALRCSWMRASDCASDSSACERRPWSLAMSSRLAVLTRTVRPLASSMRRCVSAIARSRSAISASLREMRVAVSSKARAR